MAYSTGSRTQTSMTLSSAWKWNKEMDQCLITLKKGGRSTAEAQVWMKMGTEWFAYGLGVSRMSRLSVSHGQLKRP